MPKRTTLLYTSNDAPRGETEKLFTYYCKYSGRHAFTTDVDIDTLPRRRTDDARILDRKSHVVRLYTREGGVKLLRRKDGRVERQHRLNVGELPVAYTSDGSADLLYVMDRAVTCYGNAGAGDRVPLPPCIRVGDSGNTEVSLEIEDRAKHTTVSRINADAVVVSITGSASHDGGQSEIIALMAKTLTLRPTHLTLLRGGGSRNRVLVVEVLSPRIVYARLRGLPPPQRKAGAEGARKPKPWFHGL